ncbi:uncharacterized protein LOC127782013 [Oryza glaberrima]|uniref:uncharacterized protein LOC127782013 n=1 Tax=Oryza glaberrima TaxID=4538 RepID=UPI00224C41AA|nr:uncharacterized protein LOC127782013 [Oryza glaberrima]
MVLKLLNGGGGGGGDDGFDPSAAEHKRHEQIGNLAVELKHQRLASKPSAMDCIGAIDGTHVLARVPSTISAAFRGRKKETTQNVMAAVDFDLRFTYVLAGWEGSAHDALILADALERDDGLSVPSGKYYLVDVGYATRPGFLPPYHGCRYHLKEYDRRNYPRDSRELFNLRHSSLRFGMDDHVPLESDWNSDSDDEEPDDLDEDNKGMAQIRDDLAGAMWNNRGMVEAGGGNGGHGGHGGHHGALHWTTNMSSLMLRRMVELIATGVRTDKGFKEAHLNQVARSLSDHYGIEISGTQVYNHLRKWHQRWVRITRLKDLSGALWDDQTSMIILEEEHYMGHVKEHPKDAEFLNVPLENYTQMAIIFSNRQATGRFAMGSNEALGNLAGEADSGLGPLDGTIGDGIAAGPSGVGAEGPGLAARASGVGPTGEDSTSDKKRKRASALNEGEVALISNMTDSVNNMASAIHATAHTEVHPDLCNTVMDLPGFSEDQLDLVLAYLTKEKAESLVYIQKNEARRARWVRKFLNEHHPESI